MVDVDVETRRETTVSFSFCRSPFIHLYCVATLPCEIRKFKKNRRDFTLTPPKLIRSKRNFNTFISRRVKPAYVDSTET